MALVRKMSFGVDGVLGCRGDPSVRGGGVSFLVMGDGDGGSCGELSKAVVVADGTMASICARREIVFGADRADFCPPFLEDFVGTAVSASFPSSMDCTSA